MIQGLPIPLTSLVGRTSEVSAVCAQLRRDDVRLLTLVGPGGVGKTRLAGAVGDRLAGDPFTIVRAVSLTGVTDPALVGPAIAQAMGIREAGRAPLLEQVAASLGDARVLLVLDSAECVARDGAFLIDLLIACPSLSLLATSRRVLHLTAEHLYTVPPFSIPLHSPGNADAGSRDQDMEAVELFRLRAQAAWAGFTLTGDNRHDVIEICRRLDGLPLAIELAAARTRLLPPAALLARLERRLPMLTGGPHDAPMRHQTLTATLTWSYELLNEQERSWLRRLSVFAGGFTLTAAVQVAACDTPEISVLIDHSLVHRLDHPGDEVRFAMLDTVREYAGERLDESEEAEHVHGEYGRWCQELVAGANRALGTPGQQAWLQRLHDEHDNLRHAMELARASGDDESFGRLVAGLWRFWYGRGFFTEGRLRVSEALTLADKLGARDHLDLLIGDGTLAHAQGDDERAVDVADRAVTLARQEREVGGLALALNLKGVIARDQGDYDRARVLLEESLDLSRADANRWGIVLSINSLAILHQLRGDYEQAARSLEESASLARAQGDPWGLAQALSNMAHLNRRQGNVERAAALYEESGALYHAIGDLRGEANSLTNLGLMTQRLGNVDRAIELHRESLAAARRLGDRRGVSTALANLGAACVHRGELDQGTEVLRESLSIRHTLQDREGVSASLEKLAEAAAALHQTHLALRLWAAAAAIRDAIGAPLAPAERASYEVVVAAARTTLDPETIAAIWAEGRAQPLEEVVAMALRMVNQPPATSAPLPAASRGGATVGGLTTRELDVLRLLEAHTDREIADQLFIGTRTVATHVTNILNKLGVNTRTAAVAYAIRHGYI